MFSFSFVDVIRNALGIRTQLTPSATVAAFFLMGENGKLGAYIDPLTNTLVDANRNPITAKQQVVYSASGAISVASQTAVITKTGSLAAMTLAVPVAGAPSLGGGGQDGTRIEISSATAFAHTITCPSAIINNGLTGGPFTVITLPAFAGGGVTLEAYNGKWQVVANIASTFA